MKINKTYKYKLKLTPKQERRIYEWISVCRYLYNVGKEVREESYRIKRENVNKKHLKKQLTDVRKEFDWVKDVPVHTCQAAIDRLDHSFEMFFRGKANYPKWASKGKYRSIVFTNDHFTKNNPQGTIRQTENGFNLPKIKNVKVFNSKRRVEGKIKRAIVKKEVDGYYIYVYAEQEISDDKVPITDDSQVVGIDVGLTHFCTTSDENEDPTPNPKFLETTLPKLRRAQRSMDRKVVGSNNWKKAKESVQRLNLKVKRQREDFLQKLTTHFVDNYDSIIVEDLDIPSMLKMGFSRSVTDVGWGYFFKFLKYKAEWYGKHYMRVDPKNTSRECSECGYTDKDNRKTQSRFKCLSCGHEENADCNAAKVIKGRGTSNLCVNVAQ